jgi:hypothetical protein
MPEKKPVENGLVSQPQNPHLLAQTAISSVNIETEKLGFASSIGMTDNSAFCPIKKGSRQYRKVIFLIQDPKNQRSPMDGNWNGHLDRK